MGLVTVPIDIINGDCVFQPAAKKGMILFIGFKL